MLLVGGSSRIPLVAEMVGAALGRPVAVDAHPKHAVALGAAQVLGSAAAAAPGTVVGPTARPRCRPPPVPGRVGGRRGTAPGHDPPIGHGSGSGSGPSPPRRRPHRPPAKSQPARCRSAASSPSVVLVVAAIGGVVLLASGGGDDGAATSNSCTVGDGRRRGAEHEVHVGVGPLRPSHQREAARAAPTSRTYTVKGFEPIIYTQRPEGLARGPPRALLLRHRGRRPRRHQHRAPRAPGPSGTATREGRARVRRVLGSSNQSQNGGQGATKLCVLVADAVHGVEQGSGNCLPLPTA